MKNKKPFLGWIFIVLIAGCQKARLDSANATMVNPNLTAIQRLLRDSAGGQTIQLLDFGHPIIATRDSGKTYLVRIPFKVIASDQRFFLFKTNSSLTPTSSALIALTRDSSEADSPFSIFGFNGHISKDYLNGAIDYSSSVTNGYIQTRHSKQVAIAREDDPVVELPEIIIYAPDEDYYANWDAILTDGGGSGGDAGFSSAAVQSSSAGGSANLSYVNSYSFDVASELQASKPAINLPTYMTCFGLITAADATYTATLYVRIPNPANPAVMWNPLTGNVGHTFIGLSKSGGGQTINQYVGFYASCGVCAVTGSYVKSKMVDNSGHPYDASLTLQLTASQFATLTTEMEYESINEYALGEYNCANYAVECFNSVLPGSLDIPDMSIPGQSPGITPNGLYMALENLPANSPEGQVNKYGSDQTAGTGHGACN